MSYWQLTDEDEGEMVKSRYDPIVKFSYTNLDKVVKPSAERKWTHNAYSVSDISEDIAGNNGLHLGLGSESFYSASTPHYNETHAQNGSTYTETHFNGSYDFQRVADDSRKSPNMDGSFRGLFSHRDNSNTPTSNAKSILFKECTYEERQDEINRLLRNNAKNEKFIHDISDEVPQENNNSSLVSYRKFSNNSGCEDDCISAPLKLRQPFASSSSEKTCPTMQNTAPATEKHRYSTDSETFDSEIFPKMTPIAIEKVKKVSGEILSEQSTESRADSPIDFLSRRAKFESNNNSTDYKNNVYRSVKTSKMPSTLKSTWDKNGKNIGRINYQGNVTIPSRPTHQSDPGSSKMESFIGNNQKIMSSEQTWFSSKPSQNIEQTRRPTVSSRTTTNITQSHQISNKENGPSYQKDVRERNHKTNTNLSRYGISVQEDKLLRQTVSSRKSEKKLRETFAAHDDDKSSDYESLSTSMETVIDCSSMETSERCSSVDTGMQKVGRYNKRVADIVRMFDEMEAKQHIPDGYYTWQDYKMSKCHGLSRWDDPSTNACLSKSYSNISELQLTNSPRSKSECNISELNSSYEAAASQNWYRPKSVDKYESSRNDLRNQERSYDVIQTRENTPLYETKLNNNIVPLPAKTVAAHDYQNSVSPNLVSNHINSQTVTQEKQAKNSLFHDERRSAFERHTPTKPEPEHHYENVSFSSAHSSKNSYRTERNESSFINTQRNTNLVNQPESTVAEQSNEDGNNYYVTCTIMQSRLTPLGDIAKNTEQSRKSRSSTRTESSLVDQKDKSVMNKPKVVTWGPNKTLTTSRFRSHSADPYEMTRKSAMGSKTCSGSNMNLASWRVSSPEPSPHFLHLTADAKRQAESYYMNSDQRLMNILFENMMENKYLNRSSKLKQNQDVVQQSKFIQDKDKEISQQNSTNYVQMTKSSASSSSCGIKSCLSEVPTSSPNERPLFSESYSNKGRTWTNIEDATRISKRSPIIDNQNVTSLEKSCSAEHQPSATYGTSCMETSRCDSPRSILQKRNCRLVSSPVNVGAATISLHNRQSQTCQTETKPTCEINTTGNAIQYSKKLQFNRLSQSTDSLVGYPWRDKKDMLGNPSYNSLRGMVGSPSYSTKSEMGGSSSYISKREMIVSPCYDLKKERVWSPSVNSKSEMVGSSSYNSKGEMVKCSSYNSKREMVVSPSYDSRKEVVSSPSYSSKREMVGNQSYNSKRGMDRSSSYNSKIETVGRSSYNSKREMVVSPSINSKRNVVGSASHVSKREMIWSPPCTSPSASFRMQSPASSIAFDEIAFSPRVTSPFRVISPSQGNSVVNMQTLSRSESALSARNTPQSESCVLRFMSGNTDGMSDIEYRKQMYLKSLEGDSAPPMKYQADAAPVATVSRTTTQQARRI